MNAHEFSQEKLFAQELREQDPVTLGQEFRAARLEQGITQEDLAKLAGVGLGTIKNLESGERRVQVANLEKVLKVIDIKTRRSEQRTPWEEEITAATIAVLRNLPEQMRPEAFAEGLQVMATAPARYALAALRKSDSATAEEEAMGE